MQRSVVTFAFSLALLLFTAAASHSWPIPDTGQTTSYADNDDAEYIINPPSYTKLDAQGNDLTVTASAWSTVRDNVTGQI